MVPVVASAVNPLGCEFHPLARPYWYTLSSLRTAFFYYANAGLNTFTQTLQWRLLHKRWGGRFDANAGVGTSMQTLGWTLLCKRWGGHFYANAGVDTFVQTLGWTL